MSKYVKIERPSLGLSYIQPVDQLLSAIDAEIVDAIDYTEEGEQFILTVVEMEDDKFASLPEFTGW